MAMDFVHGTYDIIHAKRGWMMQDDVVVMLSANISSNAPFPVTTALDQRNLNGTVHYAVGQDNGE